MQQFKNIALLNWNFQKNNEALDHAILMAKMGNAKLKIIEIIASHDDSLIDQLKQSYRYNAAVLIRRQYGGDRPDAIRKLKDSGVDGEFKLMPGYQAREFSMR